LGQHGLGPLPSQSALFAAGDSDFPPDTVSKPELVLGGRDADGFLPAPECEAPRHSAALQNSNGPERTKFDAARGALVRAGPGNRVAFEETLS